MDPRRQSAASRFRMLRPVRIPGLLSLLVLAAHAWAAEVGSRPPPLSEGVVLTRVQGTLVPGKGDSGWAFRLRDTFEGEADRELELLPSVAVEDMVRRFESLPAGGEARFEVTGTVTLYHGRNALLPMMSLPMGEFGPRAARPVLRPPGAVRAAPEAPVAPEPEMPALASAGDERSAFGIRWVPLLPESRRKSAPPPSGGEVQADEIERRLIARVGEAPRSLDKDDAAVSRERQAAEAAGPHGSIDPLRQRPWLDSDRTVQDRLGVVTRDPLTGGWRFVFESSRGELGEREATLLPGQVLERLEHAARSQVGPLTVVLSGTVTRFEGRAYLLPSSFSALRTGKALGR